jgi:hypothetical protein
VPEESRATKPRRKQRDDGAQKKEIRMRGGDAKGRNKSKVEESKMPMR